MNHLDTALQVANETRSLARRATRSLAHCPMARRIARRRAVRPVDYMRYPEFEAILRDLQLAPGMSVLDVGSPQWFSLCLACKHPEVRFQYINIIDSELNPFKDIAEALELRNLTYAKEDVRQLRFADHAFDRVVSISVVEHIYPEADGDLKALGEIYRVLKPGGEFLLTVPYKDKAKVVYLQGPVYERQEKARNFFAREYDRETFNRLIEKSDFSPAGEWFICERGGFFAVDYYEWGPGKNAFFMKNLLQARKLLERIIGKSLEERLARRYLNVSREVSGRLVNISAKLVKS